MTMAGVAPLGIGVGTIFETHVDTTDLERAMRFYGDTLGLELGFVEAQRGIAFYWIGGRGNAMLGVWTKSPEQWRSSHFAFTIDEADIQPALERLRAAGIEALDGSNRPTADPIVHAWMPACAIYFRDPDGNSLELLAMLPGEPRPELGIVSLSEWTALRERGSSVGPIISASG
jgi:catechol 2,3-dioxygenase-like lactoylglutathione lyase family enzyme